MAKDKKISDKMPKKHPAGSITFVTSALNKVSKYMIKLGAHVFCYTKFVSYSILKRVRSFGSFIAKKLSLVGVKFKEKFKSFVDVIKKPFNSFKTFHSQLSENYQYEKQNHGTFKAVLNYIRMLFIKAFSTKGIFVTVFNHTAPVLSIIFLVCVIRSSSEVEYAISVEYNGKVLGYVDKETVCDKAQKVMQERITYTDENEQLSVTPKLSLQRISSDKQIYSVDELADEMIRNSETPIVDCYGLYINDKFIGAVREKDKIEETLTSLLESSKRGIEGEKVSFVDSVELKQGLYVEDGIVDQSEIIDLITSEKQTESHYTVVDGDSPSLISDKVQVNLSELYKLNPWLEEECYVGDEVVINRAVPYLSVRSTCTENYEVSIPYETVKVDDSKSYKGTQRVIQDGKTGVKNVTADVSYVDGYEDSRTVVSEVVVSEPVEKKIAVGTKAITYSSTTSSMIVSAGTYMWPVGGSGGYVSSRFGVNRVTHYHSGIDIAGIPKGTAIYAARSGVVVRSKSSGSYGEFIEIDHGDGYSTLYAHMLSGSRRVKVGTYVEKGDLIGLVGSTGYSTGNHCHFEVKRNGVAQNPLKYVAK